MSDLVKPFSPAKLLIQAKLLDSPGCRVIAYTLSSDCTPAYHLTNDYGHKWNCNAEHFLEIMWLRSIGKEFNDDSQQTP